MVTNSKRTARVLKPWLSKVGVKLVDAIKLLGIATTAGLTRGKVTAAKVSTSAKRVRRCQMLTKAGAPPIRVVRSGINKAQTWGCTAMGVTDAELDRMRKVSASCISTARAATRSSNWRWLGT